MDKAATLEKIATNLYSAAIACRWRSQSSVRVGLIFWQISQRAVIGKNSWYSLLMDEQFWLDSLSIVWMMNR